MSTLISNQKAAGVILFSAAAGFILAMSVAEFLYPGYSVSLNYISDLGATCASTPCDIVQPTATIFNASVFLLGVAIVSGSYLIYRAFRRRLFSTLLVISGVGAMGVGVFPETFPIEHHLFSLIVFLFGGLAALASLTLEARPFSYLSVGLGIITLSALGMYATGTYLGIGPGGMERMVAYPVLLWGVGLGGYMMSSKETLKVVAETRLNA